MPKPGILVCVPPKCGGTSYYRAAFDVPADVPTRKVWKYVRDLNALMTNAEAARAEGQKFLVMRDPIARFISLWRDKCRNGDEHMPGLAGLTPDQLMDRIEADPYGDAHWTPQSTWYVQFAMLVPLRDIFALLNIPPYRENDSSPADSDPLVPIERIVRHYWKDCRNASIAGV